MDAACGLCHAAGMTAFADSDGTDAGVAVPAGSAPPRAWFHDLVARIAARWWLLPLGVTIGAALALSYLSRAEYTYSAELKVYAAPSSSGSRAPSALGGLAALTGLAGGAGESVTPFRFYLDGVYSEAVAARLARDRTLMRTIFAGEWDARAGQWRQPASLTGSVRRAVTTALGLPQFGWTPPDAARLQAYIAKAVVVRQSVRTPIVVLSTANRDPKFGIRLLERVHATTDDWLREQQTARIRGNIAYLTTRLATVTLAEQRAALVAQLTEQERQAMLAYANAPYAADPFDRATVSLEPTRPRPVPLLIGAGVAGLLAGLVTAALWRRRPA